MHKQEDVISFPTMNEKILQFHFNITQCRPISSIASAPPQVHDMQYPQYKLCHYKTTMQCQLRSKRLSSCKNNHHY